MTIQWEEVWTAIGLLMIIEGVLPFLSPRRWRAMMALAVQQSNNALRMVGFFSMLIGLGVLFLVR